MIPFKENGDFVNATKRHQYESKCGRYVYHIAIIDFLTQFNFAKKAERWFKINVKRRNGKQLSALPPEKYQERFVEFMCQNVFVNENENIVYTS